MDGIIKYPRTPHLKGSRLQKGDEDLKKVDFGEILNKNIVIEEKVDGANVGISFLNGGDLALQSRGHFLRGGAREIHYDLFKKWANSAINELFDILGTQYIMYGEWMQQKHKIYYDALPDYFLEFDIYDKKNKLFLDTPSRKKMLENSCIKSVPVLASGKFSSEKQILSYLGRSLYISDDAIGNLIKEIGIVPNLVEAASKTIMYTVTILLGLCVGATTNAQAFLKVETLMIFGLGIAAFAVSAICGLLIGKLMCVLSKGKINPMIGAAGVSAVPMAARVVQKVGKEEDPSNFLLMHAMGPNVAGVIGSAVAAGILLLLFL